MSTSQTSETVATDVLTVGVGIVGPALAARLAPLGGNIILVERNDGAVTVDVHDAAHDAFGYSGIGQARMGLTRFTRERSIIVRRNEAQGIESLDERLAP